MSEFEGNALTVGVSGVSSSGKTTLARLLRDIFPRVFVLHEDDFYKEDRDIPMHKEHHVPDWDCLEAINLPQLSSTLAYIRNKGMPPLDFSSKEDQNAVGEVHVDDALLEDMKWRASKWMYADAPPIAIIDGFLLYSEAMQDIREMFDVKLLLRSDLKTTKARREARSGYVTLEGFWEDPPNYVDNVVWPNYVKDHAFLFQDGNPEGNFDQTQLDRLNIRAMPDGAQGDMTKCLQWAYDVLDDVLSRFARPPA